MTDHLQELVNKVLNCNMCCSWTILAGVIVLMFLAHAVNSDENHDIPKWYKENSPSQVRSGNAVAESTGI
jgi:hypothetical protein